MELMHFWEPDGAAVVEYSRLEPMREAEGHVHVIFNLSKPLEDQIQTTALMLKELQEDLTGKSVVWRPHEADWPLCLRALDARDARAKLKDIAAAFWPGQHKPPSRAAEKYEQAVKLRDNFPM